MNKSNIGLILAIIFASSVISGSLVFFGLQLSGNNSNKSVDGDVIVQKVVEGIEAYSKKMQQQQVDAEQKDNADKAEKAKTVSKIDATNDHVRGNANADFSLIEYSDYVCPYCARFHQTAKTLVDKSNGQVNWAFRHFPLSGHDPIATKAALAAECVSEQGGADKFWAFTDEMFSEDMTGKIGSEQDMLAVVDKISGINKSAFEACYSSQKFLSKVRANLEEGNKIGVEGTPGNFLVNNKTGKVVVVDGNQPLTKVQAALESIK